MKNLFEFGLLALSSLFLCIGNLCLKHAKMQGKGIFSPIFLTGIGVFTFNFLIYSRALEKIPLSIAYPIFASLGFLLIAIASNYFFNESLSLKQWIGIAFMLTGIILIVKS
jgi:multidrug transporter EmrE-like cation transporter